MLSRGWAPLLPNARDGGGAYFALPPPRVVYVWRQLPLRGLWHGTKAQHSRPPLRTCSLPLGEEPHACSGIMNLQPLS